VSKTRKIMKNADRERRNVAHFVEGNCVRQRTSGAARLFWQETPNTHVNTKECEMLQLVTSSTQRNCVVEYFS
jgi:hypothetical protein